MKPWRRAAKGLGPTLAAVGWLTATMVCDLLADWLRTKARRFDRRASAHEHRAERILLD